LDDKIVKEESSKEVTVDIWGCSLSPTL